MKKPIELNQNLFSTDSQDFSSYLLNNQITAEGILLFQKAMYDYFDHFGREFNWRNTVNPYYIVVSEIMLQQTQTHRVKNKFDQFIDKFPTIQSLASASLGEVLASWQGLGYNRRAQSLHLFAQRVLKEYSGIMPNTPELLQTFKGIGPNTASSICAFAFNMPTVFIETNIRTVFIHTFFRDKDKIHDNVILPLISQTLDLKNPRIWYYALMDYGVMLKKLYPNPSKKSAHHTIQSKFEGSDRQIRGHILRILLTKSYVSLPEIISTINKDPERITKIANDLVNEKLIDCINNLYILPI